jgi:maltooligosyltrehalose trehalohydrolase
MTIELSQGAIFNPGNTCTFKIWAPLHDTVSLHLTFPEAQSIPMKKNESGFFSVRVENIDPSTRYFYNLDGKKDCPDPSSFFQPEGVHKASAIIDHSKFVWKDKHWKGIPQQDLILYEIHVGTFTPDGTFEAIIHRLDDLLETGINAIEIMPVGQFPGDRNWGYDGVFPFATQSSYGGPDGLKKLVDACHQKGIAVFLDVVYNHLGPEGNYFSEFGYYFTEKYKTPWGNAINFDGPWSDAVREFFSDNVVYWLYFFHLDGLRFDAIHAIYDTNATTVWSLIDAKVNLLEQQTGHRYILFAESDDNDPKVVLPIGSNGKGFEGQWLDDFHHAVYALLDSDNAFLYEDFFSVAQIAKSINEGFVHSGEYVKARKRKHGASSVGIDGEKFVAFNQNHDQIGNRVAGTRLTTLITPEKIKLAAALLFLSPYIPLLFMGEEYGEMNPFLYFTSHSDTELIKAIKKGRKKEFERFYADGEPEDSQDVATFNESKLNWERRNSGFFNLMHDWYKSLIHIRKTNAALKTCDKKMLMADTIEERVLLLHRWNDDKSAYLIALFNFSEEPFTFCLPELKSNWKILLSTDGKDGDFKAGSSIALMGFSVILFSGQETMFKE